MRRLLILALLISVPASAAETITYVYDARGRVIQVIRTGTVNNGVTTSYVLDKADNRTTKTTTGSPNPPPP
jgi:YD repeat-containing protein